MNEPKNTLKGAWLKKLNPYEIPGCETTQMHWAHMVTGEFANICEVKEFWKAQLNRPNKTFAIMLNAK